MKTPAEYPVLSYAHEAPVRTFNPSGLFWLEPEALQEVDRLINMTQMPTMSLGAETHAGERAGIRRALKGTMVPADDPLEAELHRALEIGFMYGDLIARKTEEIQSGQDGAEQSAGRHDMPDWLQQLETAVEGLDHNDESGSHALFTRLRDMEVALAGSDILAFSLAATQDHMGRQFAAYHQPDKELSRGEIGRLQSAYYAGALTGALTTNDRHNLARRKVEILRTMRSRESVALRFQFEPGDNLANALDYALSTKLSFEYVEPDDEDSYIVAMANGFQYGPNMLASPLFIPGSEEPALAERLRLEDVGGIIIERADMATGEPASFAAVTERADFHQASLGGRIVGVMLDEGCVGAYDRVHPNAAAIHRLAARAYGISPDDLAYGHAFADREPQEATTGKLGSLALSAGLAMPWLLDGLSELREPGSGHWGQDLLADALLAGGYVAYRAVKWHQERRAADADDLYQKMLDQVTRQA